MVPFLGTLHIRCRIIIGIQKGIIILTTTHIRTDGSRGVGFRVDGLSAQESSQALPNTVPREFLYDG